MRLPPRARAQDAVKSSPNVEMSLVLSTVTGACRSPRCSFGPGCSADAARWRHCTTCRAAQVLPPIAGRVDARPPRRVRVPPRRLPGPRSRLWCREAWPQAAAAANSARWHAVSTIVCRISLTSPSGHPRLHRETAPRLETTAPRAEAARPPAAHTPARDAVAVTPCIDGAGQCIVARADP